MEQESRLKEFVQAVARQLRQRRMLYYALKGAFYGVSLALIPLLLKGLLGPSALVSASIIVVLGTLTGAVVGLLLPLSLTDAARVADRQWNLQDRLPTAFDWIDRDAEPLVVQALLSDTTTRIQALNPWKTVPLRWPGELRLVPIPLLLSLILIVAPAIPVPTGSLPELARNAEQSADGKEDKPLAQDDRRTRAQRSPIDKVETVERYLDPKAGGSSSRQQGDLAAAFKDTSMSSQRPDFNSFLKRGDDRLRMLEQVDRLPDLRQDFTRSPARMVFQQMKSLFGGLRPDQISPEKLRELLNEMERLGRKGGDWGQDVGEGMEALEGGQMDRAMSAMERALSKMRAMDERDRGRRGLQGGKEQDRGGRGRERGGRHSGEGYEGDWGEGEGLLPGRGKNPTPKGDPTARLNQRPLDFGVEGEARPGRREAFDTNLLGKGVGTPSQLPYMSVYSQYRKMMEETIAREQIPFDYQSQIKEYFQSLEER
ncbi:MAG TPA: hypothetical protein VJO34_10745 [Methylomirabilota bacterium]|nr:hypothetical protein [Methylomirabilota bacterium]